MNKKPSHFKNPKALIGGLLIAIVVMAATVGFYAVRGPDYAAMSSDPGTVTVRPIVKDNQNKRLMTALLLGLVGFVYGTRFVGQRLARREEDQG